jgi:hypothetical protein
MYIQREALTEIFAPIIWAFVNEFNKITKNGSLSDYEKNKIRGRLKDSIGKTLRYWEEEQPKMVSCAAKSLADSFNKKHGTPHDITKIKYSQRNIFGGTKGKPAIMFDHTTPVDETIKKIIECNNLIEVANLMNATSEICIITRNEDEKLNEKISGKIYKKERSNGWEKCYSERGIEICYRPK